MTHAYFSVLLNTATQGFHSNPRQRMRKMSCACFIHLHSQRNKWNGSVFQATHNIVFTGPSITSPFRLSEHRADRKIPPTSGSESSRVSNGERWWIRWPPEL